MTALLCPFCGVVSDVPHQTQQACIDALHSEIARTRQILAHVTEPLIGSAAHRDRRPPAPGDGHTGSAYRVSLRCAMEG
jgi:hypothetical protein